MCVHIQVIFHVIYCILSVLILYFEHISYENNFLIFIIYLLRYPKTKKKSQNTKICFHAKLLPALNKSIQYNMATVHTKDIFTVMYIPIHT